MNSTRNLQNNFGRRIKSIYIIWYREIIIYLRNKLKLFTSLFLPLVLLIFLGTGLKTILPEYILHYDFSKFFFPGLVGLSVSTMALSSTMSIVWDREFGFLREILVAPISRTDIAIGKILGATSVALFQGFLLILAAPYVGIKFSFLIFLATLGSIFLTSYGMAAIGIYFASRLTRTESFSFLLQLIFLPMVFLSGAFFPLKTSPSWMIAAAQLNPLTYGIDTIRWSLLLRSTSLTKLINLTSHSFLFSLVILILFDVIITFLAIRTFQKIK